MLFTKKGQKIQIDSCDNFLLIDKTSSFDKSKKVETKKFKY